jgi:DNA invertase Pin-like site-specific DNA recombinase
VIFAKEGTVMAKASRQGWALVALDCAVDSTTPAGEAMAHVLATFAQFERRLIGQRTREALAAKRASDVRLGRPVSLPSAVSKRIVSERRAGRSLAAIAATLNEEQRSHGPRVVGNGGPPRCAPCCACEGGSDGVTPTAA